MEDRMHCHKLGQPNSIYVVVSKVKPLDLLLLVTSSQEPAEEEDSGEHHQEPIIFRAVLGNLGS